MFLSSLSLFGVRAIALFLFVIAPVSLCAVPSIAAKAPSHRSSQHPMTPEQIARVALPSVVHLTILDSTGEPSVLGSGFVVGKDLIATNVHVIAGAHAATANFQDGRSVKVVGVVGLDGDRDLALVAADTSGVKPLMLAPSGSAQIGDPVVAVGSPEGLGGSVSTGIVSAIRVEDSARVIQTTAPISHGSSGGALLDRYGRVLGVTSFFIKDGQNLNFAYSADHLRTLMRTTDLKHYVAWSDIEDAAKKTAGSDPSTSNASSTGSTPDEPVFTDKTLTGLSAFDVTIEDLDADAVKDGLDKSSLQTTAELSLREAKVKLVSDTSSDNSAVLDIEVNTLKGDDGLYAYTIRLSVLERVTISRATPKTCVATTYHDGYFGTVGSDKMADSVTNTVKKLADSFANEYLKQNDSN